MRIGLFGGTFDPVHTGHIQAARLCLAGLPLDMVLLMPSKKPDYKNTCHTDYGHRFEMCRLATFGESAIGVSDLENRLPGHGYTKDVLREFHRIHPDATVFLLMGREVYERLPSWKGAKEIVNSAGIVIMERARPTPGITVTEIQPHKVYSLSAEFPQVSSTLLRNRLSRSLDDQGWLCPAVAAYILANGLYEA